MKENHLMESMPLAQFAGVINISSQLWCRFQSFSLTPLAMKIPLFPSLKCSLISEALVLPQHPEGAVESKRCKSHVYPVVAFCLHFFILSMGLVSGLVPVKAGIRIVLPIRQVIPIKVIQFLVNIHRLEKNRAVHSHQVHLFIFALITLPLL